MLIIMEELLEKAYGKYKRDGMFSLISEGPRYLIKNTSIRSAVCTKAFELKHGKGIKVTEKNWDNLIIFDACRRDEFKKNNIFEGDMDEIVSRGRNTGEFLKNNFYGEKFHDTVYITANPHIRGLDTDVFHAIIDDPIREHFDEHIGTVRPKYVTESALDAHLRYPKKRLIVHYMQPHMPPIGDIEETVSELRDGFDMTGDSGNTQRFYNMVKKGVISPENARKVYRQNLRIVFDESKKLIEKFDGKSVITADHGELLGESPCPLLGSSWSHELTRAHFPKTEELCIVPWFEVEDESSTERETIAEEPIDDDLLSDDEAEKRLKRLGYLE